MGNEKANVSVHVVKKLLHVICWKEGISSQKRWDVIPEFVLFVSQLLGNIQSFLYLYFILFKFRYSELTCVGNRHHGWNHTNKNMPHVSSVCICVTIYNIIYMSYVCVLGHWRTDMLYMRTKVTDVIFPGFQNLVDNQSCFVSVHNLSIVNVYLYQVMFYKENWVYAYRNMCIRASFFREFLIFFLFYCQCCYGFHMNIT